MKIASALLGQEREKLITLPRKNGKSRVVGTFAAWHLLNTPEAQAVVVANSKEQAEIIDRYARQVAMHPSLEQKFEPRFRELRGPDGSTLTVKSADAGRLLGLTPTLVLYDEFCVAKDDEIYTALQECAAAWARRWRWCRRPGGVPSRRWGGCGRGVWRRTTCV